MLRPTTTKNQPIANQGCLASNHSFVRNVAMIKTWQNWQTSNFLAARAKRTRTKKGLKGCSGIVKAYVCQCNWSIVAPYDLKWFLALDFRCCFDCRDNKYSNVILGGGPKKFGRGLQSMVKFTFLDCWNLGFYSVAVLYYLCRCWRGQKVFRKLLLAHSNS